MREETAPFFFDKLVPGIVACCRVFAHARMQIHTVVVLNCNG
jgi:hypothetical protein